MLNTFVINLNQSLTPNINFTQKQSKMNTVVNEILRIGDYHLLAKHLITKRKRNLVHESAIEKHPYAGVKACRKPTNTPSYFQKQQRDSLN